MTSKRMVICLMAIIILPAGCGPSRDEGPEGGSTAPRALTADDIALNNRGVALMGYFDYSTARDVFRQVVDRKPEWLDAKVNLAIATLNRQLEGDETLAMGYLQEVLGMDGNNLRAHFVLGLLMERAGESEQAQQHFQFVLDHDPNDAYAAYYLAVSIQSEDAPRALELFQQAMDHDPYLRSAYYGAFLLNVRSGNRERGINLKEAYERLGNNPRARLAETKYTRMGPKANALAVGLKQPASFSLPSGSLFSEQVELAVFKNQEQRSLTTVDLLKDGQQDIFVASVSGDHHLLIAAEDEYQLREDHPLASSGPASAIGWGDIDNDGRNDAVTCGRNGVVLWLQPTQGQWKKTTHLKALSRGKKCQDIALFDADHDGDLDVLAVFVSGRHDLLSNNGDLSFRSLVKEKKLSLGGARGVAIVTTDLDHDRDTDIIIVNEGPTPHDVLWNDRLWNYSTNDVLSAFQQVDLSSLTAADIDSDGQVELYAITTQGVLQRWAPDANRSWVKSDINISQDRESGAESAASGGTTELSVADFNGDGVLDLLVTDNTGIHVWDVSQQPARRLYEYLAEVVTAIPVITDADRGPSLFALVNRDATQHFIHLPPGTGRGEFAAIRVRGKEEKAESMRSNRSGIGTQIAIRRGSDWTLVDTFDHHSGRGQSLQPIAVGLGGMEKIDFVALDWSDGVFQTELDLKAGRLHVVSETQRQLSSCPVLFTWNGSEWQFASDILGVAGIGFLHAPGTYGVPRPWEYFQISAEQLVERDGHLDLMITEPMEELAMLDRVALTAFDLAPDWHLILDERMATGKPAVTGQARFYRKSIQPQNVYRDDGLEVTKSVAVIDSVAADLGATHPRYLGRLLKTRSLTLNFTTALDEHAGEPLLMATGWVEYPYSQTVFAAWQSDQHYVPPTLEAGDGQGNWTTVYPRFGYPAGMPRTMSLPLTHIPLGTRQLRISSNLEIYWDQLSVVYAQDPGHAMSKKSLTLADAQVEAIGFPKRTNLLQRRPHYDYSSRAPFWDTRFPKGQYTEFGLATPLVEERDGAYAVIGPGEALLLRFAQVEPPPNNWSRTFVLYSEGYAKDMDMYTQDSGTVGPYPYFEDANKALHELYNTRYRDGY